MMSATTTTTMLLVLVVFVAFSLHSFNTNNNNGSSLSYFVEAITEEEQQQQHTHTTVEAVEEEVEEEYEDEDENDEDENEDEDEDDEVIQKQQQQHNENENERVCTWNDEHKKEICRTPYLPTVHDGGREYVGVDDGFVDDDEYDYDAIDHGDVQEYDNVDDNDNGDGNVDGKIDVDEDADVNVGVDEGNGDYDYSNGNYKKEGGVWRDKKGDVYDVWQHGDKHEIYEALGCEYVSYGHDTLEMLTGTSVENIHTDETWKIFNTIYNRIIAEEDESKENEEEDAQNSSSSSSPIPSTYTTNGFQYPIEIKLDPVVGRGVYALQDIPKGSLLYISKNTATFYQGQTFRNFLHALPNQLACDVMIWSYARLVSYDTYYDDQPYMICTDLDEGSFVNSANDKEDLNVALGNEQGVLLVSNYDDYDTDNENENDNANEASPPEEQEKLWYGCEMKFYASRDIRQGEEIRVDYGDFAETDGWRYLGL